MLPERWRFVHPRPETVSDSHGSEASAYAVLWRDKMSMAANGLILTWTCRILLS